MGPDGQCRGGVGAAGEDDHLLFVDQVQLLGLAEVELERRMVLR